MTPMPPCCAMAMARRDSVTVSMAAERIGMFSEIPAVSRVARFTSRGWTFECAGRSRTSSNVRARGRSVDPGRVDFGIMLPRRGGSSRRRPLPAAGRLRAVAFLVFLARAAGAGVVAADLRLVPLERLDLRVLAARGRRAVGVVDVAGAARRHGRRGAPRTGLRHLAFRFAHHRLEAEEVLHELVLDALLHQREELEGLLLVLDERVALAVAAQADSLLQVIERQQVVLPLLVHDLQHHELLVEPHGLRAEQLLLRLVPAVSAPREGLPGSAPAFLPAKATAPPSRP